MNLAIIAGALGRDAELKYIQSGTGLLRFTVATSFKRKQGEDWIEETEWHRCTLWGKRGEALAPHLTKGTKVTIQGRLKTSSYEKNGVTMYSTEIIVNDLTLQGRPPGAQQGGQQQAPQQQQTSRKQWGPPEDDDIPF